jgi:hypothetical protein
MAVNNLFELFDDVPGWIDAEDEIKDACIRFQTEIRALQERHREVGASDTSSREAIGHFVGSLIGSCTDRCLDPEWHIIERRAQQELYRRHAGEPGLTNGMVRDMCIAEGLLPGN